MYRVDRDSLGEVRVPRDAYYGPFTARALEHYNATGQRMHANMVRAYVMIKRSAALANMELNVLEREKGDAIVRACDAILAGELVEHFPIDALNSGAGTAFNMNVNEVIANKALELLGRRKGDYSYLHPNDHVNMSQSSNDTFPTALHLAILLSSRDLLTSLDRLISSLRSKAEEFRHVLKIGRTHLMDALPVTLGSEFSAYANAIEDARRYLMSALEELRYVALGGTAVGTGANAPDGYRVLAIRYLAEVSGIDLKPARDMQYALQSRLAVAYVSSCLRNLALELIRIANDLRLMASGPLAGLGELTIPAVHAGSSIMPGKVNPSLAECLNMICFNVVGNDACVALAVQAGQLELNVMLPVMARCVLDSMDMLSRFLPVFAEHMVDGLKANEARLREGVESNPIMVTLLSPYIGYVKAAELYKEALRQGVSIRHLVVREGLMDERKVDEVLASAAGPADHTRKKEE
ncbi:MAG: aspartate ammonia-lyase [Candidatus Nitrosocaldus sp.]|nr:aspartate ammonia-lyase [Candidatus Nitrosocaldus sp.]MDW8000356.1 aspartate ammonia-lyase [Candidatus Nitrosocaldus sp.]